MKNKRSILITLVTVLSGILIGVSIWSQSRDEESEPQVTDFVSCIDQTGVVQESFPRGCVYDGVTYTEDVLEGKTEPDLSLPATEQSAIESWISANNLNEYGDPEDTVYIGGTPLFNEATERYTPLYTYLLKQHPERPWLTTSEETQNSDSSEQEQDDSEEVLSFTSVSEWATFQDPDFEFEYPAFVTLSGTDYPVRMSAEDGFEFYVALSATEPTFTDTTCTTTFELGSGESIYLCNNGSTKYSQIYQRMTDSFIAR